jgi:hypothetical protein
MRKLNLGCGNNRIQGWENYDREVDISKPMTHIFDDGCARFIFAEHVVEHITPAEVWGFLEEAHRILIPHGVIRITFPSIVQVAHRNSELKAGPYLELIKRRGWGDGSFRSGIRAILCENGHKSLWAPSLLITCLEPIGFNAYQAELHTSSYPELCGVEGHQNDVGREANDVESVAVEGVKL